MKNGHSCISLLGCGWLGLPLGERLLAEGYEVRGSTTTPSKVEEIQGKGIEAHLLSLDPEPSDKASLTRLLDTDILLINIPPRTRTRDGHFHVQQIETLVERIHRSRTARVLFISSTSVYPALNQVARESDALDENTCGNLTLYQAEQTLLKGLSHLRPLVLRSAGLMGGQRIAGRYFAGQKKLQLPNHPVNYIHREDLINLVVALLVHDAKSQIYNCCAPVHPWLYEVYKRNAEHYGFEAPVFDPHLPSAPFKLVDGHQLVAELGYRFVFPDPMLF
ncbi:MAG: NAD-dependent epimerase/dehydratase family protein [Cytophagales bacterium]|nr:NAD-dependent epimerase/dehydratase family protein [Cytophagales bacterium]